MTTRIGMMGLSSLLWVSVALAQQLEVAPYTFTTLALANGGGQLGVTALTGISDAGEITGGFADSSGHFVVIDGRWKQHPLWCGDPTLTLFTVGGLNNRREVVGWCIDPAAPLELRTVGYVHRGLVRGGPSRRQPSILIGPGSTLTEALDISGPGVVVGDFRDAATGVFHGFKWHADTFTVLTAAFQPGITGTSVTGINNRGHMVGAVNIDTGAVVGFLRIGNAWTVLSVPGSPWTLPIDLMDNRKIIGLYLDPVDGTLRSFVRRQDGLYFEVRVPVAGTILTEVMGINNRDQVVGRYITHHPQDTAMPFRHHGFVAVHTPGGSAPVSPLAASQTRTLEAEGGAASGVTLEELRAMDVTVGKGGVLR